ncbi:MAG: hypothetical protein HY869_04030 [Chloroflexi bacterium]|nr:hypothetical protein [Chloroflexota bacterium]
MNKTELELPNIWPIRVWDNQEGGGGTWVLPSLNHMEVIPTLWIILQQIIDDWKKYSAEFSFTSVNDPNISKIEFQFNTFDELEPRFINCLFSYINFIFLLENGFDVMFDELKGLAKELDLPIKIPKKPKRNAYIQRLRLVRNHTVVHWGGPKNKDYIDSRAGRNWGFSIPTDADTLEDISFGYVSLVGANDRELRTLAQTHMEVTAYLRKYDVACAGMLKEIVQFLPIKKGSLEYVYLAPHNTSNKAHT